MRVPNYGHSTIQKLWSMRTNANAYSTIRNSRLRTSRLNSSAQNRRLSSAVTSRYNTTTASSLYTSVKTSAASLRSHAQKLLNNSDNSLFAMAEKSGSSQNAVSEIVNFVDSYNSMLTAMQKEGGALNTVYVNQLTQSFSSGKDAYAAVGITADRNGTLHIDRDTLQKASIEDLKKAFQGTSSICYDASVRSIYVESNAESAINRSSYYNNYYNNYYNGYNAYGAHNGYDASALLGNYFNTLL